MSSTFPPPNRRSDAHRSEKAAVERERALLLELETLRAENEHLRRSYAQSLSSSKPHTSAQDTEAPRSSAHLPLPLTPEDASSPDTAKLEYEALFAALAGVFPIGVFRTDRAGLLTHVDEKLQGIFALQREDFPNFGWLNRVHPDDLERVQEHWVRGISTGESLSVEFRLVRPGNQIAHVLVRNSALRDALGAITGQLGFVQDITQMRMLEADARIKDELNRQIVASSPDCMKVLDLQGLVVQMTTQGCRLVEVDDFESVRNSEWATWWPDDGAVLARESLESARQGKSARFVAFGTTFKGTPKWWDTMVTPICDDQGLPVMLLAVSRDITALHRQQEEINAELEARVRQRTDELGEAKERMTVALTDAQALYHQAPCGYHSIDASGKVVMMNRTELEWLGYEHADVIGRLHFRDVLLPEQWDLANERLGRLLRGEKLEAAELTLRRRDGSTFLAQVTSTAVLDSQGRFVRSNNMVVDITARKAAENALATQRTFLQAVTNSVPVQLAFFDRDLICRFANASYARWTRGDTEQLVGKHLSKIARPTDFEATRLRIAAALSGEIQRFEGERAFPDGHRFYAGIEYTPYWEAGQVQGIIIQMIDISQRKASEDQVRDANLQLNDALRQSQALYNQAPCGYHSVDANGIFVSINDTELEWLGYSREEIIGKKNFRELMLPSQVDLLDHRMQRILNNESIEATEYSLRRRDGSMFHALLSSSAVRDSDGRFLRSNTTVVDITRRKAAEMALQDNQRFLQTITDHVPGLLAYMDAQLRFRFANAEHLRLYGLDPASMMGRYAGDCMGPETWPEIEPRLRMALTGQPQHFETWRPTVDGNQIFVSANYLPDFDEQGEVRGLFVQIVDITDRKRIEERVVHLNEELEQRIRERSNELLESEQRFRLMVDNLRDYCIFFMDAEGVITDWTDSAQRMDGYAPTQMMGRHYGVLFDPANPEHGKVSANQMLRLAASRGQHELHNWHSRKDGSQYWSHSVLIALRDEGGELKGFAKINRDMTDAKRLDDLMRNINDELENRVVERTEQLLAANKDLESFSYSVSHDLRSPLRHISSFVSLLEEHLGGKCDEMSARYLSTIGNSARHMSQLIDGLLAFSRLGRSAVNLVAVDFTLLVDAVVNQIAHDTEGRIVDWVIAPDLPVVQGDALLLREVWANLLGNAYKYTRPRERSRIEVGWSMDPVVGYTFFVRDNGVGFDTKYAQKLFGVFQRLHRASEFEGTGIGLALTRRIIERHGGTIWAESRLGEGSAFYFSLPFEGAHSVESYNDSMPAALEP
ncbi:PAS domain-containing sensor histidine kinase [Hydrogenophaga sp.]|uniref:PAS domain-containing sensor histidine kinase n=1 Tax=Hydrogenophaga sp. TaxID=1904254 RepID=UPI0027241524|nr:PAS domain-containing sensor histidine kinase [Hydrogenophaga sp.]MDO9433800.1 PAS domain S-box protein [Hydrogenophaga sp.]